nr:ESX secretion-associated protein EspG [Saccharopolyspora sp. HNM0983]
MCRRFDSHLHPLLRVGRLPFEADERDHAEFDRRGRDDLARQGALDGDQLHPFLEDAMHLLARPPLAVGLAVHEPGGTSFNAVCVEQNRDVLQAYQADGATTQDLENIQLTRHEYGGAGGNAVRLLGSVTAAPGRSVSVPTAYLDEADRRRKAGTALQAALSGAGVHGADARTLATAFSAERSRDGVFTVRAYDDKVRRMHVLPVNLQFFVTNEGCYMSQRVRGQDGREWFTLAPADGRKLHAKIEEMAKALRQPARV